MQNQFENESKRHAYEIKGVRNKIYNLKKELEETIEKLNELKRICPHTETREEYDDDFHKPHWYRLCLTCGEEIKLKYNR